MKPIIEKSKLLITGGAGFIGSNLVEHFLLDDRITLVRVLDNLSNGYFENIQEFVNHPKFEFIEGDIRDYDTCLKACTGIDKISHQAALGSVPRSIENPMKSAEVNILGTVNLMHAAVQNKVQRIVLAFSSSTYGDHPDLPKVERNIGNPLSPYAVTKASIEQFADVFGQTYGLDWIGLRYFNVFGPKQNPDNPYAAVIPIFVKAFLSNKEITINGDGETSRDFTFVKNVVTINELALFSEDCRASRQTYNVGCSDQITLHEIVTSLEKISGKRAKVKYVDPRPGDVQHSLASIEKARTLLGYQPEVKFQKGLETVYKWHGGRFYSPGQRL
ncbi:SDR family oxidoreductase [Akkermansiaceae bacterium]|nr:SDR family oxidoreductase [Akkermansiaceae bacterium]